MLKFHTIGQIEHENAFEDATIAVDTLNGAFGTVTAGAFAVAADSYKAIMQLEAGDDAGMAEYTIPAGKNVRVVDLSKFNGKTIEVYGAQLPATYAKGDKLVSDANGKLEVDAAAAAPYFEITKIIGNKLGVEAKIVTA